MRRLLELPTLAVASVVSRQETSFNLECCSFVSVVKYFMYIELGNFKQKDA